jgi:hypothetical protein
MENPKLEICRKCEHFIKPTQQCGKCWCFMPAKVLMPSADCPENKWKELDGNSK